MPAPNPERFRSVGAPPIGILHLAQPRRGALALETAHAFKIEQLGLRGGRGDDPDTGFVERIDERHEAFGGVEILRAELRDVLER